MIVAIHQPNFLPWLGYFHKMTHSDVFVLLDSVAFSKNSYTTRSRIQTPQGAHWLTVPVKHSSGQLISETAINEETDWRKKHLKTLEANFAKATFFREVFDGLSASYAASVGEGLSAFNMRLIRFVAEYLGITTRLVVGSSLNVTGQATDLLVAILKTLGGTTYLSGTGGSKYQSEEEYTRAGLVLRYSDFVHPTYPQLWGPFCAGLSCVDALFNCGPRSRDMLVSSVSTVSVPALDDLSQESGGNRA